MAPKPIIRPGPTPEGPPGWDKRQQERLSEANVGTEGDSSIDSSESGQVERDNKGVAKIDPKTGEILHHENHEHHGHGIGEVREFGDKLKDGVHKIGEKLALVPPKDAESGTSTQNASTMPE